MFAVFRFLVGLCTLCTFLLAALCFEPFASVVSYCMSWICCYCCNCCPKICFGTFGRVFHRNGCLIERASVFIASSLTYIHSPLFRLVKLSASPAFFKRKLNFFFGVGAEFLPIMHCSGALSHSLSFAASVALLLACALAPGESFLWVRLRIRHPHHFAFTCIRIFLQTNRIARALSFSLFLALYLSLSLF